MFNVRSMIKYLIIGILILVIVILLLLFFKKKDSTYDFGINGLEKYTLTVGEEFDDPGYYVIDSKGRDVSNQVLVNVLGYVNTNKDGIYRLMYEYNGKKIYRVIEVIPLIEEDYFQMDKLQFELIGEEKVELSLMTEFKDSGFIAFYDGEDISQYVDVSGDIDSSTVGTYNLEYKLSYMGYEGMLTRTIEIKDYKLDLDIKWDSNKYFKNDLVVNIQVNGDDFNYLELPDGSVSEERNIEYKVINNGSYTFIAYNSKKEPFKKIININNFDKEVDSASCVINVYHNKSIIEIKASDLKSGISKYQYNSKDYTNNKIDVNSRLKSASVTVFDKLNNSIIVNCSINELEKEVYGFILIGDSRFSERTGILLHVGKNIRSNDTVIAKWGMGYTWLQDTASKEVTKILKKNPDKKYYIMTNLGYNDHNNEKNMNKYVKLLNKLANGDWKGHYLGFISVNPYMSNNLKDARNTYIKKFNNRMKKDLTKYYYCDTYNGIGYKNFKSTDKVHYDKNTDIKIYNYIINNCAY